MIRDGWVVTYTEGRLGTVPALISDEPIGLCTDAVSGAKIVAFPERMTAVTGEPPEFALRGLGPRSAHTEGRR